MEIELEHEQQKILANKNSIWDLIRNEAEQIALRKQEIKKFLKSTILKHKSLESSLAWRLASKLCSPEISNKRLYELALSSYKKKNILVENACLDIIAVKERDPACSRYLEPLLYFKGFQAIQAYRLSNYLYKLDNCDLAFFLQMRMSEVFGVDIHPNASIGNSIMIDHAHSIVIGETAIVGNNVSMLHSVTLGGTGKEKGLRHPKIGDGVLLGAGASVLGNISVGRCSKVASGSVVLSNVPEFKTVAGIPARVVGTSGCDQPSSEMDHNLN